ncbi:MAG: type III pantothenate kinase [Planctomycetota bacterium]
MPELILAIDIGNTNIHFGIFTCNQQLVAQENIAHRQLNTFLKQWKRNIKITPSSPPGGMVKTTAGPDKIGAGPDALSPGEIVSSVRTGLISSTRPRTNPTLNQWVRRVFRIKPLQFNKDFKSPIPVLVDEPEKVGSDRILNAIAAYERTKQTTVVIDFGTAITFDVISQRGEFLGGVIAPGINLMARGLHRDCALLPLIKPEIATRPIGKNTTGAMQAGLYFGTIGLANQIIDEIIKELDTGHRLPKIVATGRDAELFKTALPKIQQFIPGLTLEGLLLAYLKTKNTYRF